jgi:transcriptional regulator with XRE-family HTH domain
MRRVEMSAAELAERSGVDATTISRYLSGERRKLQSDRVTALAMALGVTVDRLMRDDVEWQEVFDADALESRATRLDAASGIDAVIAG